MPIAEAAATGGVTLATVWLLGVSMGLTACTVTCLPFMGTWALGRASGRTEAFLHTGVFLAGRVATYTLLATLAGAVGIGLAKALGGVWGNAAIGAASILAGLWLLRSPARRCGVPPRLTSQPVRLHRRRGPFADAMHAAGLAAGAGRAGRRSGRRCRLRPRLRAGRRDDADPGPRTACRPPRAGDACRPRLAGALADLDCRGGVDPARPAPAAARLSPEVRHHVAAVEAGDCLEFAAVIPPS